MSCLTVAFRFHCIHYNKNFFFITISNFHTTLNYLIDFVNLFSLTALPATIYEEYIYLIQPFQPVRTTNKQSYRGESNNFLVSNTLQLPEILQMRKFRCSDFRTPRLNHWTDSDGTNRLLINFTFYPGKRYQGRAWSILVFWKCQ